MHVKNVLFVLRGRPGLGHVIPGLALAKAASDLGAKIHIATYAKGFEFLNQPSNFGFDYDLTKLTVRDQYFDWPGLCPYDNGVREIMPLVEDIRAEVCVFGGEYLMGPLLASIDCKSASTINPEILIDTPKNRGPSAYMCRLISNSDYVVPLQDIPLGHPLIPEKDRLIKKLVSSGPFTLPQTDTCDSKRPIALIANGGGIDFPKSTSSYSSSMSSPQLWIKETVEYTEAAIKAALEVMGNNILIKVFSCLSQADNARLRALGPRNRLHVSSISPEFYQHLYRAEVVISRSGMGFLADIDSVGAHKLIWALSGHDEQIQNATEFVQSHDNAFFCQSPFDIHNFLLGMQQKSVSTGVDNSRLGYHRAKKAMLTILEENTIAS